MTTPGTPRTARNHGTTSKSDSVRWSTLLDRLGVAALTDEFLLRVTRLPHYEDAPLPAAELRRTGEESFEALIRSLRSTHPSGTAAGSDELREVELGIATDVGVSRARAGIPVDALMTAIRLDFSVLWDALMAVSGPEDAPLLVARANSLWQVVDAYASQTQGAYLAERQRMATEASSVRQGLVASLFGVTAAPQAVVERAASVLGIAVEARLSVAVAAGEDAAALRVCIALAARRGAEVFTHPFADALLAFWPTDGQPGSALYDVRGRISALRCGLVDDVVGLAGLHDAGELALELARLTTEADDAALLLQTAWARLAGSRLGADGIRLAADVDAALAGCGQVERERLVETACSYLATGSVAASAEKLFCHRNTLMNRMRRFSELTGIDLAVPEQAARLVVAWS